MKKALFAIGIVLGFVTLFRGGSDGPGARADAGLMEPWSVSYDEIRSWSDEDVEWEIIDRVDALVGESWSASIAELPPGVRMVYTTWVFEAEVYNGGFDQFFLNTEGEITDETLADLHLLGAREHISLLEQAMTDTDDLEALRALDDRFYELDSLQQRRIAFIRSRPEAF